jgi:hypothetical protein
MHYTTDFNTAYILLTAGDYPVHRAANIVPLDDNFGPLEQSIKRTGLIEPITLYKGEIIDGRRRAIVCKELGVIVREDEISGIGEKTDKEIYEFVLAKNNRRSLSKAQLAMIAAIETEKNAHTLMGIPRATDYAKNVWDVSKVTYDKAKFILKENRVFAQEIFSTGFAHINGERTSMAQTHQFLKDLMSARLLDGNHDGDPEVAMFYVALDGFIGTQTPHISKEKIAKVLERKLKEMK